MQRVQLRLCKIVWKIFSRQSNIAIPLYCSNLKADVREFGYLFKLFLDILYHHIFLALPRYGSRDHEYKGSPRNIQVIRKIWSAYGSYTNAIQKLLDWTAFLAILPFDWTIPPTFYNGLHNSPYIQVSKNNSLRPIDEAFPFRLLFAFSSAFDSMGRKT